MEILLFSHDPGYSAAAIAAGVAKVVVDWESSGKAERQIGRDTEINRGTVADLIAASDVAGKQLICRINNTPTGRDSECRLAIEHGASEIWLPMVRSVAEIEQCLRRIDGEAQLGVLVETREGMQLGRELQQLPLSRVYIGLHDYRIDCANTELFAPIVDGTLDGFRSHYSGALGFAGVTRPTGGNPIPQQLLLAAMMRTGCTFGVARRSFRADVTVGNIRHALAQIAAQVEILAMRSPTQVLDDHQALARIIAALPTESPQRSRRESLCAP